ncbi:MAG: MBL fold metallo-hydrolase [Eubacterium sp.]|nr:MBL fold metallo-hydrolase [Eubacterium sp.]
MFFWKILEKRNENVFVEKTDSIDSKKQNKKSYKKAGVFATVLTALALTVTGCSSPEAGGIEQSLADYQTQNQSQADAQTAFYDANVDGTMTVRFLDVGQGNSVLVECDGRYMLIDGGDYDYSSYVVAYLKNQGVETLDYMVVSHYDSDHLSGCVGALRAFDVEMVICPDYEGDTKTYYTFADDLEQYAVDYVHPEVGDVYEFASAEFTVVCPEECDYSDENDNSVGIRLTFGSNSFLVCGDAGEESEEDMVESGVYLQSDVYMAGHHGSAGSSTYDFLQKVQPEAVVISAGFDNSYGHPAKATMNRLKNTGADIYRTDLQGELIAVCDGTDITWNVEPSNDFRCGEDVVADGSVTKPSSSTTFDGNTGTSAQSGKITYILNTNSEKIHLLTCGSVADIDAANKKQVTATITELETQGYSPCKRCLD